MTYFELVRYVFKRFSLLRAFRTGVPTLLYYLRRKPLRKSEKPALFTMTIMPPLFTVWYHCARKALGDRVDITVFDSSGVLDQALFPGVRVQKFLNLYAATKSEEFLRHVARNRRIGWICDDDVFLLSGDAVDIVERELRVDRTASVSFRPRGWWNFVIDGKKVQPSSSYCTAFNREILIDKENLHLGPCDGNSHPTTADGSPVGRYDTCDKANEELLRKGYRCCIVPEEKRDSCITGFAGTSSAVMLLWYFRTPEQTLDFFRKPPPEAWSGNTLFTALSGMLALCTIQELYTEITGAPYPLPSLPQRSALEEIRASREPHLREGHSFTLVDTVSARLHAAL